MMVRVSGIRILTAQSQRNLKTMIESLDPSLRVLRLPRNKTNKGLCNLLSVEGQSCYWCSQSRGTKESVSHHFAFMWKPLGFSLYFCGFLRFFDFSQLADTMLLASLNQKHRGAKHSPLPNSKVFITILHQTHKVEKCYFTILPKCKYDVVCL